MRLAWRNILHDCSRSATSEHVREIAMGIRGEKGSRIITGFAGIECQPGGMKGPANGVGGADWLPTDRAESRARESAKIGVSDD
jgi:hypothetical protein